MLEFRNPIPVITEFGEGYALYVTNGGTLENDIWAVVSCSDGSVKHFRSDQIKIHKNGTFDIAVN
jgi:hypothetical protein